MKIGITNDHRGVEKKAKVINILKENNYQVIDYGTLTKDSVDFPDYAFKLSDAIINKTVDLGIAICGTGTGMSIALNKVRGIYCGKINSPAEATLCKAHNNCNCIALSEELDDNVLEEVILNFINTPFSNINKYVNRNNKIKAKEDE